MLLHTSKVQDEKNGEAEREKPERAQDSPVLMWPVAEHRPTGAAGRKTDPADPHHAWMARYFSIV